MNYLNALREQFNNRISFREKRPGIQQLIAPLYHEDGDMVDIFIELLNENSKAIRISDFGMTTMRLSYHFDIDTPNKERIFQRIITENKVSEKDGVLYIDTKPESLYPSILQFAQTVAKISNMELYKREVIQSLFYEMLTEFIEESLREYNPKPTTYPISDRDDLEVDFQFDIQPRPIYLFGVKDNSKARLITISCLEFHRSRLPFKSAVVHEDLSNLSKKDLNRITSAADKQFPTLEDFIEKGEEYLKREVA